MPLPARTCLSNDIIVHDFSFNYFCKHCIHCICYCSKFVLWLWICIFFNAEIKSIKQTKLLVFIYFFSSFMHRNLYNSIMKVEGKCWPIYMYRICTLYSYPAMMLCCWTQNYKKVIWSIHKRTKKYKKIHNETIMKKMKKHL